MLILYLKRCIGLALLMYDIIIKDTIYQDIFGKEDIKVLLFKEDSYLLVLLKYVVACPFLFLIKEPMRVWMRTLFVI